MLNAENLTVRYGAYTAVSRLSFTLEEGQWLMLVGPNGAGKSSLISAIAQCVPYEGTIRLEGKNLRDFRPAELARKDRRAVSAAYGQLRLHGGGNRFLGPLRASALASGPPG